MLVVGNKPPLATVNIPIARAAPQCPAEREVESSVASGLEKARATAGKEGFMENTEGSRASVEAPASPAGNRFDRMEWAGAFGDLGTLIPFVVAYIGVLKMDPFGVLFAFGAAMVVCGAHYRTPFPVQPMKAAGAVAVTQAAQSIAITPAAVYGAGLVTGCAWLLLGVTGAADKLARLVDRPVVVGIILGLGMGFMLEGIRMMNDNWLIAAVGLAGTLLLLTNRTIPAMFLLLLFGAVCGAVLDPEAVRALQSVSMEFRLPTFALADVTLKDLAVGAVFLALPQLPLTLGNAVIAIKEENNRLFPHRPVTEKGVAVSTGVMNLFGAAVGGVPMCHGAGGMAGHVRFGARTGGALVILGCILLCLALFFSGSVEALFGIFPKAVLGVILFLTGAQLALGACDFSRDKGERFVTLVTAAFAVWNVGLAFVVGLAGMRLAKRNLLRL
jgi:MFS superfamily sulfate permease-like transporter